ncbi:MAG TPA: hypothetical protein VF939_10510 [Puia sp.]
MNDFGKWLYRIVILLLVIILIDFNLNWPKTHANGSGHLLTTNLVLLGLMAGMIVFKKLKRRL